MLGIQPGELQAASHAPCADLALITLAPTSGGLFGRLVSMSTLLILPAYIVAAVAMARAETGLLRAAGVVGAAFGVWVATTPSAEDALITLMLVLIPAPLFVFFPAAAGGKPALVA